MAEANVESELSLLSLQNNINISNFIIHEACKTYHSLYQNKWIPLSFIEFFFEEYKLYGQNKSSHLDQFFAMYSQADLTDIVSFY